MKKNRTLKGLVLALALVALLSLVLTACKSTYTVTLETYGGTTADGTAISSVQIERGSKIEESSLPTPQKPDLVFTGWYKDKAFKNMWDFSSDKVRKNLALYARYADMPSVFVFTEIDNGAAYAVSGATGSGLGERVTIPSSYKGKPVTTVLKEGFQNRTFEAVTIPSSIVTVEEKAFYQCRSLKTVTFESGSNLKTVGENAFAYDTSLKSISFPASLEELSSYAMAYDSLLETVSFPADSKLKKLSSRSFYQTVKLSKIGTIGADDKAILPASLQSIGQYAFYDCVSLSSLSFTNEPSLTDIESYAFYGSGLIDAVLPKSLSNLGSYSFYNCKALRTVSFQDGSILTTLPSGTFSGCLSLHTVTLPPSIERIESAFPSTSESSNTMSSLKRVNLNSKITSGFDNIFVGNKATAVFVPDSLFNDYITQYSSRKGFIAYYGMLGQAYSEPGLGEIAIVSDCIIYSHTEKENDQDVNKLTLSVYFGTAEHFEFSTDPQITDVGRYAFAGSYLLKTVTVHQTFDAGASAFENCQALESVYLDNVKSIGQKAFYGSGVKTVILDNITGDNLTAIKTYAFADCKRLESITLSRSIEVIESYAFQYCKGLKEVKIPANSALKEIHSYAFHMAENLIRIDLPNSLEQIGNSAFYGCASLKYSSTTSNFISFTLPSGLQKIYELSFAGCSSIEALVIPNGTTEIGNNAFLNCKALESVTFAKDGSNISRLEIIGDNAFNGCANLQKIELPGNVKKVGDGAFYNCRYLKAIFINSVINEDGSQLPNIDSILKYDKSSAANGRVIAIVAVVAGDNLYGLYKNAKTEYTNNPLIVSVWELTDNRTGAKPSGSLDPEYFEYYDRIEEVNDNKKTLTAYFGTATDFDTAGYYSIGSYALSYCNRLIRVNIDSTTFVISSYAFESSVNIELIELDDKPLGGYQIGSYAFRYCVKANIIIRGADVMVYQYAFYGWGSAQSITVYGMSSVDVSKKWSLQWRSGCSAKVTYA